MLGCRSSRFGAGVASHGFAAHFDAMGVVDEAVEDGIGVGGITDHFMPSGDGELAGDERRAAPISVLEDFEQMVTGVAIERFEPPVVEDEEINPGNALHARSDAAVAFGQGQFVDQPWQPGV